MKIKLCLLGIVVSSILGSCNKPGQEPPPPPPPPAISVDKMAIYPGQIAGQLDSFIVESNVNWKLAVEPAAAGNRLQFSATTGAAGKTTVKVTTLETGIVSRTATITVTPEGNANTPSATVAVSQEIYARDWQTIFGGGSYDYPTSMVRTTDGGYVFCGMTTTSDDGDIGPTNGEMDMLVVKLNATGSVQWKTTIGGSGTDASASVIATADGGYVVCGQTNSTDHSEETGTSIGGNDLLVVKLDGLGNRQWHKRYGGTGEEYVIAMVPLADGGFVMSGHTNSPHSTSGEIEATKGGYDVWIMKLDASGSRVWSNAYGGSGDDFAHDIIATVDGGFLVSAEPNEAGSGDVPAGHGPGRDMWLIKLSAVGTIQWSKTFGGNGNDFGLKLTQGADGNFVACGYTTSNATGDIPATHGSVDAWVIKVNTQGTKIWSKTFGGGQHDKFRSIAANPGGSFFVAGESYSNNNGDVIATKGQNDAWVMKLDASGNKMWSKTFGGNSYEYAATIVRVPGEGVVVGAVAASDNDGDVPATKGNYDIWIFNLKEL